MKKQLSALSSVATVLFRILKILAFLAGGFLIYRNRKKLHSFFTRQGFLVSAAYAILIAFIALFYRCIIFLNWLLQQGR
jgi:hypothetical protein